MVAVTLEAYFPQINSYDPNIVVMFDTKKRLKQEKYVLGQIRKASDAEKTLVNASADLGADYLLILDKTVFTRLDFEDQRNLIRHELSHISLHVDEKTGEYDWRIAGHAYEVFAWEIDEDPAWRDTQARLAHVAASLHEADGSLPPERDPRQQDLFESRHESRPEPEPTPLPEDICDRAKELQSLHDGKEDDAEEYSRVLRAMQGLFLAAESVCCRGFVTPDGYPAPEELGQIVGSKVLSACWVPLCLSIDGARGSDGRARLVIDDRIFVFPAPAKESEAPGYTGRITEVEGDDSTASANDSVPAIHVNMDKTCARCGQGGATQSGFCIKCVAEEFKKKGRA